MSQTYRICTLASGSSGNVAYAESAEGALLIDAGISLKKIEAGMQTIGADPRAVRGVLVTHDHIDHIRSAGAFARKYGAPLFMTRGTATHAREKLGKVTEIGIVPPGETFTLAGFRIETIPTPHDGVEPMAVVLERGAKRAGVLTDLGHVFPQLAVLLPTLDVALLESNYDDDMLRTGPYPESLKARIRAVSGHISNAEAGSLLRDHGGERLSGVLLAHLSESNNHPKLARQCVENMARARIEENPIELHVAPRHVPSPCFVLATHAPCTCTATQQD